MDVLWQEIRTTLFKLGRRPTYSLAVIAMLALGIGVNTAVFSLVQAVFLRPLPYAEPDRLVAVWPEKAFTKSELVHYRDGAQTFDAMAAMWSSDVTWQGAGAPDRLVGARVTAEYFPLLGVAPALGRTFRRDETEPGSALVVLSHGLWLARFGGDPGVLGRAINLDGVPHQIIGVMPAGFFSLPDDAMLWRPVRMNPERGDYAAVSRLSVLARLRPEATLDHAQTELRALARQRRERWPKYYAPDYGQAADLRPLAGTTLGSYRQPLLFLQGAVVFVLLIACVNIANLLQTGNAARARELSVRAALGARRAQLVRLLVIESMVLALAGGALGLGVAHAGIRLLALPSDLPAWVDVAIDGRVLFATLGASLACGLVFGLLPAFRVARAGVENVRQSGRGVSVRRLRQRTALVAAEVALALILIAGAGLMLQSLWRLRGVNPGFDTERLLTLRLDPPETEEAYEDVAKRLQLYDRIQQRVAALPGIESAVLGQQVAIGDEVWGTTINVEGKITDGDPGHPVRFMSVGVGYFESLGNTLLAGRTFAAADRSEAQPTAIVNQRLARQLWGDRSPIGQRLCLGKSQRWMTVVGVTADVKQAGLDQASPPTLFRPLAQSPQIVAMSLFVRTAGAPLDSLAAVRDTIWAIDPQVPISNVRTLDQVLDTSLAVPRLLAQLLGTFAVLGLILSVGGIFGVVGFLVSQQTREIGVRMALGARPGQVLRGVLGEGLTPVAVGMALGLLGVFALSRVLGGLLYGIAPQDPRTLGAVLVLVATVASAACYLPARRATRIDPTRALRSE